MTDLAHVDDQAAVGIAADERSHEIAVVCPHLQGERRIIDEGGVAAAKERIDYLGWVADDEKPAGIGKQRIPEIEKQHRPRVFPSPGLRELASGGNEIPGDRLQRFGHVNRISRSHETGLTQSVRGKSPLVKLEEIEIFEMPERIAFGRPHQSLAKIQSGGMAERCHQRCPRAVHA